MTHCISPSEYYNDYYNNDSFNKINLQLHASSKVSNPYSFSIKSNTSFSGDIQAALPATETLLARTTYSGLLQINIPNGVNVLKVIFDDTSDFFEEDPPYGDLYNNSNKKYWSTLQGSGADSTAWEILYVGVTPNKSYTLNVNFGHSGGLELRYSSKINTHTVDVADY